MIRPTFRRTLRVVSLEARELMAAGGPTAQQQYMLELLNLARTNPAAMAERVTSTATLSADTEATLKYYDVGLGTVKREIASPPAKPPLAWNGKLAKAAQAQSQDQANHGFQSHTGSDGSSLE